MTMATKDFVGYAASYYSEASDTSSCTLVSVGLIKMDTNDMTLEYALSVPSCTNSYKIHSMHSSNENYIYTVGTLDNEVA